ncbi:Beta-1-syntrophin [Trachymyrmex zeteki]|uniref:Beta-1-syntrophin n=1 Tax=Mycetomoellerius zeteki TaxID=64791 RepID=A0A151WQV4_9HYME|nr:Beta-1-syntrophin [Trachymyrmex zeteki]
MRCETLRKRTPDGGGCRVVIGDGRILELHSPDGVHECWLRAADNTEANVWFNALHSALAALTLKALRLASALPDPQQLQHIGWLARRHCLQVREVLASRTFTSQRSMLIQGNFLTYYLAIYPRTFYHDTIDDQ